MTREEQINKEKIYNQLTELLGAIDKQPKSIEVVLDKRQLNIAEEAEKRYLGRPPYQYYSAEDLTMTFREGAEYADANPKSPWISVKERLPIEEKDGLSTKVLVLSTKNKVDFSRYDYDVGGWISPVLDIEFTHWMPIPKLPNKLEIELWKEK